MSYLSKHRLDIGVALLAEEMTGEGKGERHLAASFRTAEQQGMGELAALLHRQQPLFRLFLSYDLTEIHCYNKRCATSATDSTAETV